MTLATGTTWDLPLAGEAPMKPLPPSPPRHEVQAVPERAPQWDRAEHRPLRDRVAQQRIWQARLVSMAAKGRGSDAQRLAGRLLAEHGLDARRVLLALDDVAEAVQARADELLADCGLAVYGVTTHQADQGGLL